MLAPATRIAYSREGAGEPLLLVHGLGSRRQIWSRVVPLLAHHFDVVAIDLPGFGESPVGNGSAFPRLLETVAEFVYELDLGCPHVAGNSLGGALALELGVRGLVRSVTAFSPIGFWRTPGRIWCQQGLGVSRAIGVRARPVLPRLLASAAGRIAFTGLVFGRPTRVTADEALADALSLVEAPGFAEASASFTHYRFGDAGVLPAIPATIAWGGRDLLLPPITQAARARAALPSARHVALSAVGHTPFYDDPELCARVITQTAELTAQPA